MLVNPAVAIIYLTTIGAIAATYYLFKSLAWLLTPGRKHDDEIVVGYEAPWVEQATGQNHSTVFYGSKHAVSDKPYQHQNGQTGPPEV